MTDKKFHTFSVPLGLLDYVNPVFYTITMLTLIRNLSGSMGSPYNTIFKTGAIISIFFGFLIPTGKVLVGLKIVKFRMPVSLVFCVNTGIFLSGMMLAKYVTGFSPAALLILGALIIGLLILIYVKTRKMNTVAVLIGAAGYLLIYNSLITMSIRKGIMIPVILYGTAILLFVMLCGIGIRANLKDPRVHWVIEISNVICQGLVALATVLLFR